MIAPRPEPSASAPRLRLSLQQPDARHRAILTRSRVQRWLRGALQAAGFAGHAQFAVRVVDAPEGQALNQAYRQRDYATDVLTFPYTEPLIDGRGRLRELTGRIASAGGHAGLDPSGDAEAEPDLQADIVLCAPVIERQAGELKLPLVEHYAHLLVHGALHALGHDHERDAPARRMELLERRVLAAWGIADPYAAGAGPTRGDGASAPPA